MASTASRHRREVDSSPRARSPVVHRGAWTRPGTLRRRKDSECPACPLSGRILGTCPVADHIHADVPPIPRRQRCVCPAACRGCAHGPGLAVGQSAPIPDQQHAEIHPGRNARTAPGRSIKCSARLLGEGVESFRMKQPFQSPVKRVTQPANVARGHEQLLLPSFRSLSQGHRCPRQVSLAWERILSTPQFAKRTFATDC